MKSDKKARLEHAGWVVGDAAQFLKLSAQEQRFVELKLALATGVRQLRERRGLTQAALAKRLGSSQSRVAKMEAADTSVSLDLMMRSLLSIGATPGQIARLIKKAEAAYRLASPAALQNSPAPSGACDVRRRAQFRTPVSVIPAKQIAGARQKRLGDLTPGVRYDADGRRHQREELVTCRRQRS